jgi:integrase
MKIPSYLYRNKESGIYYLRMPGKPRKSLRTRDPKTARRLRDMSVYVAHSSEMLNIEHNGTKLRIEYDDPKKELETAKELIATLNQSGGSRDAEGVLYPSPLARECHKPISSEHKFSLLIKDFISHKETEKAWVPKTRYENEIILNTFLEIVSDIDIGKFTHEKARDYVNVLKRLPPNRNKNALYRGLSIEEILRRKPIKTISVSAIRRHTEVISSLLNWAIQQGYITVNTLAGKTPKEHRRPDEERLAFTQDDLKRLFSKEKRGLHSYCYWLPYIALYSGMRIEESCQLRTVDIKESEGVWYFDIHGNLKNRYSERKVPIHSRLIELGFLDYVRRLPEGLIFPDLRKGNKQKYSEQPSKWFGRYRGQGRGKTPSEDVSFVQAYLCVDSCE